MDAPATAVRSLDEAAAANTEVVFNYLHVFETGQVADLRHLVAEDVLVHGAGIHAQGRSYPESSVLSPGLSNCRVKIVELWGETDLYSLLRQLGHVPAEIPEF